MAATETLCSNAIDSGNQLNVNSVLEISSKQELLSLALRTLRFSKSNLYPQSTNIVAGERKIISLKEVAHHDTSDDCWIILFDRVYDVTDFLDTVSVICDF